jgi:uncharacterized protein (DUF1697 family)
MHRYIAFLRAINVGGHTVRMDVLRTLFEALKLTRVETFIASGNVIFDSRSSDTDALERRIERHLEQSLGYQVATFLRSPAELAAVVAHRAFDEPEPARPGCVMVAFLKAPPAAAAARTFLAFRTDDDGYAIQGREAYCRFRTSILDSTFSGARMEKVLGMPATMRNMTTVRKLAAKYAPPAAR